MSEVKTVRFYLEEHPVTGELIDDEIALELPAEYEVCDCCRGRGTTYLGWHASEQPAFTAEDFYEEGPDFQEDYMSGQYDRACPECKGRTTTLNISWDKLNKKDPLVEAYLDYLEEESYYQAQCEAERRMGC